MKIILMLLLSTLLLYSKEKEVLKRYMGMEYEVIEKKGDKPTLKVIASGRSKSGKYTLVLILNFEGEILTGSVTGKHGGYSSYINASLKKQLKGKKLKKDIKLDAISKATSTTNNLRTLLRKSAIKVDRLIKKLNLKPTAKLVPKKKTD